MAEPDRASAADRSRIVDTWIPMDDGVRLAVTLYLPRGSAGPQPCLLEALPYRKDDLTWSYRQEYLRLRDEHGYAVARVDLRGTGSSEGLATDEYPVREQQDLVAVIAWLAARPWCSGRVGMYGTSYSGFNALQVACERPPALAAVVAVYATDDRYTDDVHYTGGVPRGLDLVDYCHYMTAMNALPPVPEAAGDGWRQAWRDRIDGLEPWLLAWLEHQRDGEYWRHGSLRPDYGRIACPVMLVSGWADGYRNATFRTIEGLLEAGVPCRLLAGPWSHASPATARPGPRIDLVPQMAAWWDRWLRVPAPLEGPGGEPAVTYFMRRSTRPSPVLDTSRGEWRAEDWPTPRVRDAVRPLEGPRRLAPLPATGTAAWISCAGHLPWGQPLDQRTDDAVSMVWEWDAQEAELLGEAGVDLQVAADRPVAYVSAKICDVFPDGTSALVTRGLLDLTRAGGLDAAPTALSPGVPVEAHIALEATAYAFDPGHRLRLSIAGTDWPNTLAPPEPATLEVLSGSLTLPLLTAPSAHPAPELDPGDRAEALPDDVTWLVERDILREVTTCRVAHVDAYPVSQGPVSERYTGSVSVEHATCEQRVRAHAGFELAWPQARVATSSDLDVLVTRDAFDVTVTLEATCDDEPVAKRRWRRRIARDVPPPL